MANHWKSFLQFSRKYEEQTHWDEKSRIFNRPGHQRTVSKRQVSQDTELATQARLYHSVWDQWSQSNRKSLAFLWGYLTLWLRRLVLREVSGMNQRHSTTYMAETQTQPSRTAEFPLFVCETMWSPAWEFRDWEAGKMTGNATYSREIIIVVDGVLKKFVMLVLT
jgi:hypothetical protein